MLEKNLIYNTDCLAGMQAIEDKSIDMILCDLPYGVTDCRWDSVLPFGELWAAVERIIKDNGAIVLTATSRLPRRSSRATASSSGTAGTGRRISRPVLRL